MNIASFLGNDLVQIASGISSKDDMLKAIAQLAVKDPKLSDFSVEDILKLLKEREAVGSTGFGHNIAIPHCVLPGLSDFVLAILVVPDGVDFKALDGAPSKIFVLIAAPPTKRNEHVRLLSHISRVLHREETRDAILEAKDPATVREIFFEHVPAQMMKKDQTENCAFHIIIQNRKKFNDIVQIFSDVDGSYVTVIEGKNAGKYLHEVPLFAGFWDDKREETTMIILAVVRKSLQNEVVRRINTIVGEMDKCHDVLVMAHDVTYLSGSVDF